MSMEPSVSISVTSNCLTVTLRTQYGIPVLTSPLLAFDDSMKSRYLSPLILIWQMALSVPTNVNDGKDEHGWSLLGKR